RTARSVRHRLPRTTPAHPPAPGPVPRARRRALLLRGTLGTATPHVARRRRRTLPRARRPRHAALLRTPPPRTGRRAVLRRGQAPPQRRLPRRARRLDRLRRP